MTRILVVDNIGDIAEHLIAVCNSSGIEVEVISPEDLNNQPDMQHRFDPYQLTWDIDDTLDNTGITYVIMTGFRQAKPDDPPSVAAHIEFMNYVMLGNSIRLANANRATLVFPTWGRTDIDAAMRVASEESFESCVIIAENDADLIKDKVSQLAWGHFLFDEINYGKV